MARQLNRWGVPAISLVPKVGVDWLGVARKDGAEILFLPVTAPARNGYAIMGATGRRFDFFTDDPVWSSKDWTRACGFLPRRLKAKDWLVVAGSVPKGARRGWWRKLFEALKKKGVRLVVDSRGPLLREALQAGVDWAKANLAEAEETTGVRGTGPCLRRMDNLSGKRSSCLVTVGSRGLVLQVGGRRWKASSPRIRVRDATGSGDVATAALVFGLRKKWPTKKIAGWAARMAAANAGRDDTGRVPFRG